jgi:hypothetical protein
MGPMFDSLKYFTGLEKEDAKEVPVVKCLMASNNRPNVLKLKIYIKGGIGEILGENHPCMKSFLISNDKESPPVIMPVILCGGNGEEGFLYGMIDYQMFDDEEDAEDFAN